MAGNKIHIKLEDLVEEDTINCVEIYIISQYNKDETKIQVGKDTPMQINFMQNATLSNLTEYHHRDMTYTFDLADDGQKALQRTLVKDTSIKNLYALSYKEDVIPSHRFPCNDDLSHKNEIERRVYRVNNRMFIYYDKVKETNTKTLYYMYLRYNHAANVDLKKMQIDLDNTIQSLVKEAIS